MDKEQGVEQKKNEGRCPSIKEVFGYTSVVVLSIAIIMPIEVNYGIIGFVRSLNLEKDDAGTVIHSVLDKLGLLSTNSKADNDEKVFTKEELKQFSGDSNKIYLAFLGRVYDVTKGRKHYGEGGGYAFFAGKDGTRGFVTGQFDDEGLIDNIEGLEPSNYLGLINWQELYEKEYTYVGKLDGYFYDRYGNPKDGIRVLQEGLRRGKIAKEEDDNDQKTFPPCNSYYSQETGSEVWCSNKSGGVSRDWIGVPRKFFRLGGKTHRCACVNKEHLSDPRFKEFKDCPSSAERCKIVDG